MNSRIVMRHLMRHRHTVFWGDRAFCAVSLPLDLFPEQPPAAPPPAPPGYAAVVSGWSGDPREECLSAVTFTDDPAFEDWHWLGAYCAVGLDGQINHGEQVEMPPADLLAHAQQQVWCERWLQGEGAAERSDLLVALNGARNYAATAYSEIRGANAVLTYSVKWSKTARVNRHYRPRRGRFCSALAKALDLGGGRVRLVEP